MHLLFDGGKHPLALHVVNDQGQFPEPAGQRRDGLCTRLDMERRRRDTGYESSLQKGYSVFLSVGRHMFRLVRYLRG